ncbi:MAG: hypothetical protein KC476_08975, partial [Cyanobacteria bacterium HKST-UBA06]|nr:hypothetical protein [Cyanobacteria bacterium HKST-UBA06]
MVSLHRICPVMGINRATHTGIPAHPRMASGMTHGLNHDLNNGLNNSLALYRPTTRTAAVSFCGVKPGESLKQRFKATPFAETVADVLALWLPGYVSPQIPGGASLEVHADADELLDRLRDHLQVMPLTVLSDEDMDAPGTGLVDRLSIEYVRKGLKLLVKRGALIRHKTGHYTFTPHSASQPPLIQATQADRNRAIEAALLKNLPAKLQVARHVAHLIETDVYQAGDIIPTHLGVDGRQREPDSPDAIDKAMRNLALNLAMDQTGRMELIQDTSDPSNRAGLRRYRVLPKSRGKRRRATRLLYPKWSTQGLDILLAHVALNHHTLEPGDAVPPNAALEAQYGRGGHSFSRAKATLTQTDNPNADQTASQETDALGGFLQASPYTGTVDRQYVFAHVPT